MPMRNIDERDGTLPTGRESGHGESSVDNEVAASTSTRSSRAAPRMLQCRVGRTVHLLGSEGLPFRRLRPSMPVPETLSSVPSKVRARRKRNIELTRSPPMGEQSVGDDSFITHRRNPYAMVTGSGGDVTISD